ncbi:Serine hydrolase (FSH1)-like protein [Phytophthora palmivora]|uniref:Serine hydrolase (FSH1)-like protein n=1 Tax=Phytophthora palmivora TaxID=4796 RepID=A0A2P4XB20_9STRA|nr:Serine hydrolase (FSH1)-like protein [Phytophthora palmivora]
MNRPIRVLCLHGWRTSGSILQRQTSALHQAFGSKAELVFVDAPWKASGPAPELVRSFYGENGPFYQWWDAIRCEDGETFRYEGFEHSLDYLVGQIQALGRVDAVLGGILPSQPRDTGPTGVGYNFSRGAIDIPSVHVMGKVDPLTPKSEKLFRSFTNTRRVKFEHDEGHKFPSPLKYKQLYYDIAQEVLSMTGQTWA